MGTIHRARAVLNVNKKQTSSVTKRAKTMQAAFKANAALFPKLDPSTTAVEDQLTKVDAAETVASTKARGTAKARNVQLAILVTMLEQQATYAQSVADTSATPEQAMATIEAAGLVVALVSNRTKPLLAAKQGPASGSVSLDASATALGAKKGRKSFFNWSYTGDGGKTFTSLPPTAKCKTTVASLTPLTTYGFRVSLTRSDGTTSDWSPVVLFVVH